jgi:phage terminase large subunit GpA-like protein
MMDVIVRPDVHQVTIQSSAQMSKTEILLNICGYYISYLPSPIMIVQPTFSMAEAFSKDRINPLIRDTPIIRDKIRDARARDSGNTLLHKSFPGGHLTLATSQSPSQLAGRIIRVVMADEVDRFPTSSGEEGDPLALMVKRSATFWDRKFICTSTPTIKNYSRIEKEYLASDQRKFMLPCPRCKTFQELKFEQLKYEESDPKSTTRYQCPHCEQIIDEHLKTDLTNRGRWQAQADFKGHAGFHINELYSPWKFWHEIVQDYLKAKQHEEILRVFQNTSLGLTYETSVGERLDWKFLYLNNRREYLDGNKILTDEVLFITMGVDVQADRLELEAVGWAGDKSSYSLMYEVLLGDTTQPAVWNQLTDIIENKTWKLTTGIELPITITAIDSGFQTQIVYNYCRKYKSKTIPVKGSAYLRTTIGLPKAVDITLAKNNRIASSVRYFPVGTNLIKGELFSWLKLERSLPNEPSPPGYCHFPDHYTDHYFQGLTSEAMKEEVFRGERRIVFKRNTSVANEPLDIRVYSRAAASLYGLDRISKNQIKEMKMKNGFSKTKEEQENLDRTTRKRRGAFIS